MKRLVFSIIYLFLIVPGYGESEIKMIFPTFAQNDSGEPKEKTENKTQDSTGNDEKKNSNPEIGKKKPSIGGMEIPVFNPASDTVEWDGRVWKVDDNRVFRARFEKYLNSPESKILSYEPYFKLIENIMDMLSAENASSNNLDAAFKLLPQAASYDEDANISDAIANQVLGAWQAQRQVNRVAIANKSLEEDRKRHEWNLRITSQKSSLSTAPKNPGAAAEWAKEQEIQRAARTQPHVQRLAEVNALIKSNQAKNEISEIQSRLEFQSLIVQLFLQRRFNHTLIASRFYRSIFKDGDNKLRLGERSKSLFARVADIPPTVNSIDSIASEAIRDVKESVEAVKFLLSKNELESVSCIAASRFLLSNSISILTFPYWFKALTESIFACSTVLFKFFIADSCI